MGFLQRFLGAEGGDENADRSPENARRTAASSADIRALTDEIRRLRESLGGERAASSSQDGRNRRGGRGRNRRGDSGNGDSGRQQHGRSQHPRRGLPKEVPEDAPTGPLVDYLKGKKVVVYEGQDDLARNEAFEHLARHIGQHFSRVAPFYEKMKRCVATGHGTRVDIDRWSDHERSAAVQLGTMLHRHGLLKDFYYHRSPKRQLRVIPTKDGSTAQFLTGGWLEIYVAWLLSRRLRARMNPSKFQVLFNVKGTLPDKREFEADLMACVDGRMLWVECKTGNWQDYSARFKGLVKVFGCDRDSAGLLLIRPPDASTRKRATSLLDMTLLALDEVSPFFNRFLGLEDEAIPEAALDEEDRTAPLPLGIVPPLKEEEIPLQDAAPAKKLGRIQLEGGATDEDSPPRRRRRRRGRRGGRGRARSEESADKTTKLNQAITLHPVDEADTETTASEKPEAETAKPETEKAEATTAPRRRRRRRRTESPFEEKGEEKAEEETSEKLEGVVEAPADEPEVEPIASSDSEPETEEPEAEEPEAEEPEAEEPEAEEEPLSGQTESATGVTIAPDLASMLAKPKDED